MLGKHNCGSHEDAGVVCSDMTFSQGSCQQGWVSYSGRCYQFFTEKKIWIDAEMAELLHHSNATKPPIGFILIQLCSIRRTESDLLNMETRRPSRDATLHLLCFRRCFYC
ncbi:snaclec agkisacutacin subunit A-like [Polypterus senegalus]|uniref:snaclec agkisacutacin subunit A-like n=1 Tax=Polypterus senegalus TaxID=55291 RepID=UPI001965E11D|nr:snaclec agkisacutacin subunit A-like [Polypterus senegalus]